MHQSKFNRRLCVRNEGLSASGSLLRGCGSCVCSGNCGIWGSLVNLSSKRFCLSVLLLLVARGGILPLDTLLHGGPDIEDFLLLLCHHVAGLRDKIFVLLVLLGADLLEHLSLLRRVHHCRRVCLLQITQLLHSVHVDGGSCQVLLLLVAFVLREVLLAQRLRLVDGRPAVELDLPDVSVLSCELSGWLLDDLGTGGCLLLALLLIRQILRKLTILILLGRSGQLLHFVFADKRALSVKLDLLDDCLVSTYAITFHFTKSLSSLQRWDGLARIQSHERQVCFLLILGLLLSVGNIQSFQCFDFTLHAGWNLLFRGCSC